MPSQKQNVEFLESYLKKTEELTRMVPKLCYPDDFITPDKILFDVPSIKEQNKRLINYSKYLTVSAKKAKSPMKLNRLAKYAELLSDPNIRTKRAECLVARKKRVAERRIENFFKPEEKAKRAAQLARDNGFDGGIFFKTFDDPTSLQSIKNLSIQKEIIPQIIAAIEKPVDNSIISEGAELITIPQVARMLGWGESVVRQRDKEGRLPAHYRFGGTIQWRRQELLQWLKAGCPSRQRWEQIKQGKEI